MGSKKRYIEWKRLTEEAAEELARLHATGKKQNQKIEEAFKPPDFIKKWRK